MLDHQKKLIIEQFLDQTGRYPNLVNPKSYNEKIQWLKLNYKNPLMTVCADKYAVRNYVSQKIGKQYLIPLIGKYKSVDQIDFEKLPHQFVLKVNTGSGYNIICKSKTDLNISKTKIILQEWLKPESNHYYFSYEWAYKYVKPLILCEQYLEQSDKQLYDYKIMCFDGVPHFLWVDIDRFKSHKRNLYDLDWNLLDVCFKYPNDKKRKIQKPPKLRQMLRIASKLSHGFPHARVDLYVVKNRTYFGEITFYSENGMGNFQPIEWDYKVGDMINIPVKKSIVDPIAHLENELISKEIKYGGFVTNIPRHKVSKYDPRSKKEIKQGGMTGGDRMLHHGYARYYSQYLQTFLNKKHLNIIEFGILKGSGLAIWCDIFEKARIYGMDIDLNHIKKNMAALRQAGAFKSNSPILHVYDQYVNNLSFLRKVLGNNKVDICIDDGPHTDMSILRTLNDVQHLLSKDSVYFIEDNPTVYKLIRKQFPKFHVRNYGNLTILTKLDLHKTKHLAIYLKNRFIPSAFLVWKFKIKMFLKNIKKNVI